MIAIAELRTTCVFGDGWEEESFIESLPWYVVPDNSIKLYYLASQNRWELLSFFYCRAGSMEK